MRTNRLLAAASVALTGLAGCALLGRPDEHALARKQQRADVERVEANARGRTLLTEALARGGTATITFHDGGRWVGKDFTLGPDHYCATDLAVHSPARQDDWVSYDVRGGAPPPRRCYSYIAIRKAQHGDDRRQ
jgi:hypothetical protein